MTSPAGDASDITPAAQIEEDMTDAGKAAPRLEKLTIAVAAGEATGKTTLLIFLLEAMADAGMLSVDATKRLTEQPMRFLSIERKTNEGDLETITIDVDLNVLWELRK